MLLVNRSRCSNSSGWRRLTLLGRIFGAVAVAGWTLLGRCFDGVKVSVVVLLLHLAQGIILVCGWQSCPGTGFAEVALIRQRHGGMCNRDMSHRGTSRPHKRGGRDVRQAQHRVEHCC